MKDLSERGRLWRRAWRRRARRTERRGVLMLVVLSMLVLFLLIGTTFLVTSSQHRTASKIVEKANRTTFQPEDVLERALMQALRDTNNGNSAIRYHSLLRDYYGADGFVASVYPAAEASGAPITAPEADWRPRYAGATAADPLGPTEGQLVDLFVRDDNSGVFNDGDAVGLDLDGDGLPTAYGLQTTDNYYNGCLLTMLDGPCRGVSVRVVEYDYLGSDGENGSPVGRFRVMAPRRVDGQSLQFGYGDDTLTDFLSGPSTAAIGRRLMVNGRPLNGTGVGFDPFASPNAPRLTAVERFIDATGTTYRFGLETALLPNPVGFRGDAVAHLRNGIDGLDPAIVDDLPFRFLNDTSELYGGFVGPGGADESYDAADFQNLFLASQSPRPRVRGRVVLPTNPGDVSPPSVDPEAYYATTQDPPQRLDLEDLPIPSFHRPALVNYWLHRIHRRLVLDGAEPQDAALALLLPYGADFRRDTPGAAGPDPTQNNGDVPLETRDLIVDIKRRAMLRPLSEDYPGFDGSNPLSTYDSNATALNGAFGNAELFNTTTNEITFPYWEAAGPWDVDNDRDGAPDSVWVDLGLPIQKTEDGRLYKPLVAFLIEDLDGRLNLNAHGSTEHLAADENDFPDGGASNDDLDATSPASGGLGNLAQDYDFGSSLFSSNQLAHGSGWGPADITLRPVLSPDLPLSDFQAGRTGTAVALTAKAQFDDYARLLVGRPDPRATGRLVSPAVSTAVAFGRYGSFPGSGSAGEPQFYSPGRTFNPTDAVTVAASREERTPYDFAGYPEFATQALRESGFGQRPDLFSRYAEGLGPTGASVHESVVDGWIDVAFLTIRPTLDDNPYELDLSADARRRSADDLDTVLASYGTANPLNDDATFSPAELERLLRAFDADADKLPDRLWNLVDAFDPDKLAVQDAIVRGDIVDPDDFTSYRPGAVESVVAQAKAAIHRRQVTTESFDPPVPNENWTARLLLGADGLPGAPFVDDDGDTNSDEGDEAVVSYDSENEQQTLNPTGDPNDEFTVSYEDLWNAGCDDYPVVMLSNPPTSARITDWLRYRIVLELARKGIITLYPDNGDPRTEQAVIDQLVNQILFGSDEAPAGEVRNNNVVGPLVTVAADLPADLYSFGGLLAPESLAGLKMNLNRPFGDGRDNNGNGVVDEPQEAGEPFVDLNGNQVWDGGEPYHDLDNDGRFYADFNNDGVLNNADWQDFDGDGEFEPVVDSLWPTVAGGPFPLDYTRGADANGRGAFVDTGGDGGFQLGEPRIFDDNRMARQLYARHLYCLMLALVDDNYLAPYDELDPQTRHYLDPRSGFLAQLDSTSPILPSDRASAAYRLAFDLGGQADPASLTADVLYQARRRAMRKLTCRQIAQWAINCVDIRDPDAIQTPFEYDENPWDGWNVTDSTSGQVFPLDGDLATDENDGFVRQIDASGWVQDTSDSDGDNDFVERVIRTLNPGARILATDQSRGVVWGAERPELLLNEGLALHDRRLSDVALNVVEGPSTQAEGSDDEPLDAGRLVDDDDDLDQRVLPKGSAFVELYNPWSADDQKPREMYSRQTVMRSQPTPTAPTETPLPNDPDDADVRYSTAATYRPVATEYDLSVEGVALDRLSNGVALRRDPARFEEERSNANPEGKEMRIDGAGFRIRPNVPGVDTWRLYAAASPVWRVICVEEHPDVRNAVENDDPRTPSNENITNGAAPAALPGEQGPWVYRRSQPGGFLNSSATDELPMAYREVAEIQQEAAPQPGSIVAATATQPFLQPDPDWPEFDRFARPEASFADIARNAPSAAAPTVNATGTTYLEAGVNAPLPIDRVQLSKPDRFIERAFYFIGPPELQPPATEGTAAPTGVLRTIRRNTVQPGLLVPDLSYEIRGSLTLFDEVRDQIQSDLSAGLSETSGNLNAIQTQSTDKFDEGTLGLELWQETAPEGMILGGSLGAPSNIAVSGNRFVVTDRFDAYDPTRAYYNPDTGALETPTGTRPEDDLPDDISLWVAESLPLAPILPGRYAVLGAAGTVYEFQRPQLDLLATVDGDAVFGEELVTLQNRYTTLLSREVRNSEALESGSQLPAEGEGNAPDGQWTRLRRIELAPNPNPNEHQVFVRFNGTYRNLDGTNPDFTNGTLADDGVRSSEVVTDATGTFNLTDPLAANPIGPYGVQPLIQPVVAVPIDDFNVSTPLDGYVIRRTELYSNGQSAAVRVSKSNTNPEGEALPVTPAATTITVGYDQPLDVLDELIRDQTTPNYRTLHLQRLANPLLAWNPPPLRPGGQPVPEHDPDRPVNPYLTVDSLPLDLYAYNGAEAPTTSAQWEDGNGRALATTERGLDPANVYNAFAAFPQPGDLDNMMDEATYAAVQQMTPRDLWRAFTHTAYTVEGVRYVSGSAIPDPIPEPHPDVVTYDDNDAGGAGGGAPPFPFELQHSLGYANRGAGALLTDADLAGANADAVDLNGDGVSRDLVGVPSINQADDDPTDNNGDGLPDDLASLSNNDPAPALHWPNRPFTSAGEIVLTPAWSSSRLLTYYSTFNPLSLGLPDDTHPNAYDGDALYNGGTRVAPNAIISANPEDTNRGRWRNQQEPFGHLLNFFQTASLPSTYVQAGGSDEVIAYGAPHFYRILDYVHTPSRFVETDTLLNPQVFGPLPPTLDDPRIGLSAPFNRVDHYREPGRVNLNTVGGLRDTDETPSSGPRADRPADLWSAVYDGLMHRREDYGAIDLVSGDLLQAGHLGPAWRDVVLSRRGYIQPTYVDGATSGVDYSPGILHPDFPTTVANPLRSPDGGDNVPLTNLRFGGVDASMLRAHVFSPGEDGAWGTRGRSRAVVDKGDDGLADSNLLRDDADEAGLVLDPTIDQNVRAWDGAFVSDGLPDRDIPLVRASATSPRLATMPDTLDESGVLPPTATTTPMFSGASTEPALNTERNPHLRYSPITRLTNLTSSRSGVFAVWITVGYFEVTPANENPAIWPRYMVDNNSDGVGDVFLSDDQEDLFFRVYQDGMTLGEEIDLDIGENRRMRGFYLIDRTLPVAFKPGDDVNVEDAILLRRRIE